MFLRITFIKSKYFYCLPCTLSDIWVKYVHVNSFNINSLWAVGQLFNAVASAFQSPTWKFSKYQSIFTHSHAENSAFIQPPNTQYASKHLMNALLFIEWLIIDLKSFSSLHLISSKCFIKITKLSDSSRFSKHIKRTVIEALLMNMTSKNMRKATVEKCTIAQDVIIPTKTRGYLTNTWTSILGLKNIFAKCVKKDLFTATN